MPGKSDALTPVRAWYGAITRRDWDTLRALVDPQMEFVVADGFPAGGRYLGPFAHPRPARDGKLTWLQQYIDTAVLRDAIEGRLAIP